MTLTPLDILNGIFGLSFVIISIILGLIIALKYFKNKDKNFILIGFTWVFITSGWYGTSFSFLSALILGGEGLSFEAIMLLNFIPLPVGLLLWLTAFTNFMYKEKQKLVLIIISVITVIFYVLFFYYLFTDPILVGEKISPVDTKGNNWVLLLYLVIFILIFLITGVKFSLKTIKIDNPETKLKGKLLLIAFISFSIGSVLDSMVPSTALTLIIFRLILISSAIEFYGGFILPKWIKKFFLKQS